MPFQALVADVPLSCIHTSVAAPGAAPRPARGSRLSFDEDRLDPNQLQLCDSRALREGECGDRSRADHFAFNDNALL
ncbi:hypothetical protein M885DRAFT_569377 [Pelagophyceae sp. CCMP2097]|nr:hypothetical protein M885DRAFT_569377 [Pelagophyceae sp. CCMP2097]